MQGTNKVLKADTKQSFDHLKLKYKKGLPSRGEQLSELKNDEFDVLVIGGGATGAGVALDSVTRGLKTAIVELDDFSSGTSSRSTKVTNSIYNHFGI